MGESIAAMNTPPRLLTIAGSDSGGGAGIQADLKTFAAFGCHGMSAVTAITAQSTVEVRSIQAVDPSLIADQIDVVFEDIGVDAVKVGMLGAPEVVRVVADRLRVHGPLPLVVDPVMVAKTGDALGDAQTAQALLEHLLPITTLVTPNLPEAALLVDSPVSSMNERGEAARALSEVASAALIKGGHGEEDPVVDLLFDGARFHRYAWPRLATRSTHGTGCTLSAAIAAGLGTGLELEVAVERAGSFLHEAMSRAFPLGSGHGPVNHLVRLRRR